MTLTSGAIAFGANRKSHNYSTIEIPTVTCFAAIGLHVSIEAGGDGCRVNATSEGCCRCSEFWREENNHCHRCDDDCLFGIDNNRRRYQLDFPR
jgi:hypothetical protein